MSRPDNNNPGYRPSADPGRRQASAVPEPQKFAHELANLLDGSLRNVGLVMASLRETSGESMADAGDEADLVQRLETVNGAMQQMAHLIHRWMMRGQALPGLYRAAMTIEQMTDHAVRLLKPAADHHHVTLHTDVAPEAAPFPAGEVSPILTNALRNSIEAIASQADRPQTSAAVNVNIYRDGEDLVVIVTDNGPGLDPALLDEHGRFIFGQTAKPDGHGLGLALGRDIAEQLGGTLRLANRAEGGAMLTLRYPADAIVRSDRPLQLPES